MATKIETDLSPEQFHALIQRLAQTKGGMTGPAIRAVCAEFGVTISHETANQYRDGVVARELERLRANAEKSKAIVELVKADVPIDEANAVRLKMAISDKLDALDPAEVSLKDIGALTTANEKLRTGGRNEKRLVADLKIAEARLKESDKKIRYADERIAKLEREKAEWLEREENRKKAVAAAVKKAGLTADTRKLIEAAMKGEAVG